MTKKELEENHNKAIKEAQVAKGELQKVEREKKEIESKIKEIEETKDERDHRWAEGQRDLMVMRGKIQGMTELMEAFGRGVGR